MAVCTRCGTGVTEDARFCPNCGLPLLPASPPPAAEAPVAQPEPQVVQAQQITEQQSTVFQEELKDEAPAAPQAAFEPVPQQGSYVAPQQGSYVAPQQGTYVQQQAAPQQTYYAQQAAPQQSYYAQQTQTVAQQAPAPQQGYYAPQQGGYYAPQQTPAAPQTPPAQQQSYYAQQPTQQQSYYAQQNQAPQNQAPQQNYYTQNTYGYQQTPPQGPSYQVYPGDIEENKGIGVLCYLGILLLIPLLSKPNSGYIKFHSNQGLVLLIMEVLVGILSMIPYVGWFIIGPVGYIFSLVCVIMGIINTVNGQMKPLPLIGKITLIK